MKKLLVAVGFLTGFMILVTSQGFADDTKKEIEELKRRIAELEKKEEAKDVTGGITEKIAENISFSGGVELDFSYADDNNIGDNTDNDPTSDLDIGTVELGAEIKFHEYVTGNLILKGENLDNDDRVFWDEATIMIKKEGFPLYFVGGKRGQPFGVFESHLINDPVTQDCYEIAKTGATIGFTPDILGLDASLTVYKGEVLMDHMLDGAYGLGRDYKDAAGVLPGWRTGGMSAGYAETDDVSSYIGNITVSPIEGLTLTSFYDSEPGDGDRNETIGSAFNFKIWKFTFDAEYIKALSREKDSADNREYKESAWFGAVAFQVTEPLELAVRYEGFDDDIAGDQDGILKNRYSLGANYTLFEKKNFSTTIMAEYRKSDYEKASGSISDDKLDEFFTCLAIEF